jgi:adenylosuccinate lyase
MKPKYISPLSNRYGSENMHVIWSDHHKISVWRTLWYILAESQKELGINITDFQLKEMKDSIQNIDISSILAHESKTKHDVVANLLAFGDLAPSARKIMHLGATSQYIVDNAESVIIRDSMALLILKTAEVIGSLSDFAFKHKDIPTIGLTHLQPAQPTTVGKRATLWTQDFISVIEDLGFRFDKIKLRGAKGTTGTQSSFLNLFDGDVDKVQKMDGAIAEKLGFNEGQLLKITGQTASRINDAQLISSICLICSAASKFANDVRILNSRMEMSEGFEDDQVGSSAMAYKQNPITCEKICSLSRYMISLLQNPYQTAGNQWMERTLDDSANKRILLPEIFILADEILDSVLKVSRSMRMNFSQVEKNYNQELPFFITENVIVEAVKQGVDRQDAHEEIRKLSMDTKKRISEGKTNNLVYRLSRKKIFKNVDVKGMLKMDYTGMASKQVEDFVDNIVEPIKNTYLVGSDHGYY